MMATVNDQNKKIEFVIMTNRIKDTKVALFVDSGGVCNIINVSFATQSIDTFLPAIETDGWIEPVPRTF